MTRRCVGPSGLGLPAFCLGDTDLPLEERLHNLGSKYSLQRHFDRRHPFRPREPCPFPYPECAAVTLNTIMYFENYTATVYGVYISNKISIPYRVLG